ncbi:hypothetical protein [Lacticaseibacillus porcinae]|uniref:hypothetical protein n=1 Tax=Lacticaseibacillus porcinae TaxID=1123687 RepID=UPI000F77DCD8|nr:hypothetical protein [Lacticaseibacillus porcinae]
MMYYTLISKTGNQEQFLFENPDTGLSKTGTFDRENVVAELEAGNLGWPATDGRLRSIMLNAENAVIGVRELLVFG